MGEDPGARNPQALIDVGLADVVFDHGAIVGIISHHHVLQVAQSQSQHTGLASRAERSESIARHAIDLEHMRVIPVDEIGIVIDGLKILAGGSEVGKTKRRERHDLTRGPLSAFGNLDKNIDAPLEIVYRRWTNL